MSALSSLKPGLSDSQKEKAAAGREQLKRDLEQQMREKKDAEARRKAEQQAEEEAEEAAIRQYYGRLAREQAAGGEGQGIGRPPTQAAAASRTAAGRRDGAGRLPRGQQGVPAAAHGRAEVVVTAPGIQVMVPACKPARRTAPVPDDAAAGQLAAGDSEDMDRQPAHFNSQPGQPAARASRQPDEAAWPPPLLSQQAALLQQQQQQQLWGSPYASALLGALPLQQVAALQQAAALQQYLPLVAPPGTLPGLAAGAAAGLAQAVAVPPAVAHGEVVGLLRELQAEQIQLRQQFSTQAGVLSQLQGDVQSARRERDRAREDLQRVQQLLSAREGGRGMGPGPGGLASGVGAGWQVAHLLPSSLGAGLGEEELVGSTHFLPGRAQRIPSRLGTPHGTMAEQHGGHQQQQQQQHRVAGPSVSSGRAGHQPPGGRRGAGGVPGTKASAAGMGGGSTGSGGGASQWRSNGTKPQLWRK